MTKPAKLLASALLCAALGFPQPANAITINFDGGTAEVTCMAAGIVSPECQGFVLGSADGDNFPDALGVLSSTDVYGFTVLPSNPDYETEALNILAGTSFVSADDITVTDTSGVDTFAFDTLAEYFMLKLGSGHFFFQNNSGLVELSVTYTKNGAKAGGISHVAEWGLAVISLPAALPMYLAALGGLFWVGRRRRRGVAGAP